MSKWNSKEWPALCSGEACPICLRGKPYGIVAALKATYLTSSPDSPMRGYGCLVLKRHAVELYELDEAEACALMGDIQVAARAIQHITGAMRSTATPSRICTSIFFLATSGTPSKTARSIRDARRCRRTEPVSLNTSWRR